jgi:hypothetical protein
VLGQYVPAAIRTRADHRAIAVHQQAGRAVFALMKNQSKYLSA